MESGSSPPAPGVRISSEIWRASATSMTSVRANSAAGGSRQCAIAAETAGGNCQAMLRWVPDARFVARGELAARVRGIGVS